MTGKQPGSGASKDDGRSRKNMAETLVFSPISPPLESWVTSPELIRTCLHSTPDSFIQRTEFLLENQNISTGNLLRADILYDSAGVLKTPEEKERKFAKKVEVEDVLEPKATVSVEAMPARDFPSFKLKRTVIRRYIPRNTQIDRALDQTCHFYEGTRDTRADGAGRDDHRNTKKQDQCLVTYSPHYSSQDDLPFYHPSLRSLALLYNFDWGVSEATATSEAPDGPGLLSIHFLPFPPNPPTSIPNRLERTFLSILSTHLRLSREATPSVSKMDMNYAPKQNPFKDNLVPQHIIQTTYTRLKTTYSADLIRNWIEKTEPSKHVFEDLAIAAFLIELWRGMYGVKPLSERGVDGKHDPKYDPIFPGFVDIACGNGLLVYILLVEGYWGWGFDARRRKTWSIFPEPVQAHLKEEICIPKPFKDAMSGAENVHDLQEETLSGIFSSETFIISNHADELTPWTPLLATLSNPDSPLPFLAIPCCSHSLSGARYRYPPPKSKSIKSPADHQKPSEGAEAVSQPSSGDLKALRASKIQAQTDYNSQNHQSSTYGSLTAKVIAMAEEIGIEVEKTVLRIPSTRNIGIVGGRKRRKSDTGKVIDANGKGTAIAVAEKVHTIVERECSRDGGVNVAANIWVKRASSLREGPGRGKVNLGRKIPDDEHDDIHEHEV